MWKYNGSVRPPFADEPGPGQESVWDYPRPPTLVSCDTPVEVLCGAQSLARTVSALRLLETASPPTYYLPAEDVDWTLLSHMADRSFCEWKGAASYWALAEDILSGPVGWSYENPSESFATIDGYVSFYPARVACYVGGERVEPQPGGFYGGWVTNAIVGPIKGAPGTGHW
jgi:uncharacterized protein (DUF427 family)